MLPAIRGMMAQLGLVGQDDPADGSTTDGTQSDEEPNEEIETPAAPSYEPRAMDVLVVRAMMQKALRLPLELVNMVFDYAEYWPHTSVRVSQMPGGRPITVLGGGRGWAQPNAHGLPEDPENFFLFRTLPLGFVKPFPERYHTTPAPPLKLEREHALQDYRGWIGSPTATVKHPCRKIVFTIVSHDQGWGGAAEDRGTYHGSFAWFDAGLERFDAEGTCTEGCPDSEDTTTATAGTSSSTPETATPPPPPPPAALTICALRPVIPHVNFPPHNQPPRVYHDMLPSAAMIQCNRVARREPETYRIEWSWADRRPASASAEEAAAEELAALGRGRDTGDGEFVRSLRLGDAVTVWAKARFPGWANHVASAQVDVYWAV